jgi:hypothetical protein
MLSVKRPRPMTLTHLLRATGRLALALLIPFVLFAGGASLEAKGGSKSSGGKITVKGHVRKDGTYVPPHTRSAPGTKSKAGTGEAKRAKAASARATAAPRDARGRFVRSDSARRTFMKSTGYPKGRPGYVVDHVVPLACGGPDSPSNMQWQSVAEAKAKDKTERAGCR